jgi:hypothetical protein
LEQDGKVEKWEVEVFERIKSADEDKSGSINVKELFGVIKGAAEADRQKRLFRRLFFAACALLLLMLLANMALTAAVVFLAKDTITPAVGVSKTPGGMRKTLALQAIDRQAAYMTRDPVAASLLPSLCTGEPIRPGAYSVGANPKTSRARRLHEFHGRMLISVADLPKASCDAVLGAAKESGESKGNTKITNKNGGASFVSGRIASIDTVTSGEAGRRMAGETAGSEIEVVSVVAESGETMEIHVKKGTTTSYTAYMPVSRERMRKLEVDEARNSRRRLAAGIDDDSKLPDVGCAVYHCFEGEQDCATPSPRDACAEWADGSDECREPLCAFVIN